MWLYSVVINALGDIGAAQALPEEVFTAMSARFATGQRAGEREDLARAFSTIAQGSGPQLPTAVLDALAAALAEDKNYRIRVHAIYALAYSNAYYPQAKSLLAAATGDSHRDVSNAAAHGLRIIDVNQTSMGFTDLDGKTRPISARCSKMCAPSSRSRRRRRRAMRPPPSNCGSDQPAREQKQR